MVYKRNDRRASYKEPLRGFTCKGYLPILPSAEVCPQYCQRVSDGHIIDRSSCIDRPYCGRTSLSLVSVAKRPGMDGADPVMLMDWAQNERECRDRQAYGG